MHSRTARIVVVLVVLFALLVGGLTGTAAAQEEAASACGQAQGVHHAVGEEPGADFGHAVSDHAQTVGPPGQVAAELCNPA